MKSKFKPVVLSPWQYIKEWFQRLIGTYPYNKKEIK